MGNTSREPGTMGEISDPLRERRRFLKKAGKVALTAPAVALLLSAADKSARASTDAAVAPSGLTDSINVP